MINDARQGIDGQSEQERSDEAVASPGAETEGLSPKFVQGLVTITTHEVLENSPPDSPTEVIESRVSFVLNKALADLKSAIKTAAML